MIKKDEAVLQVVTLNSPKPKVNGVAKNGKSAHIKLEDVWKIGQIIPTPPADLPEPNLSENALYIGKTRYAKRDAEGNPIESSREKFWRVAYNIAVADLYHGATERESIVTAKEFYAIMASQSF